ncbi:hypothetical protein lerEdw1_020787 [Lerista edwardsae]|nr:hypothetical protein lerEdw1_020787 [Lerista edwardsae]
MILLFQEGTLLQLHPHSLPASSEDKLESLTSLTLLGLKGRPNSGLTFTIATLKSRAMNKILLLFLVLLFCVFVFEMCLSDVVVSHTRQPQGLLCNYCGTIDATICGKNPKLCKIGNGEEEQCYSKSIYKEDGTYTGTKYGCTRDKWDLIDCNRTVKAEHSILAYRCCTTDKCNKGIVPFPPPQCVKPTLGF